MKSSFSNRPWKRKPLSAHKAFSSRMNLTWYKPKVWNYSTRSQYFFFQMAFKLLYKMNVCVYWELATQHDVCWLISHGLKNFSPPKCCQLLSLLLYLCVPACACFIRMLWTIICCCKLFLLEEGQQNWMLEVRVILCLLLCENRTCAELNSLHSLPFLRFCFMYIAVLWVPLALFWVIFSALLCCFLFRDLFSSSLVWCQNPV